MVREQEGRGRKGHVVPHFLGESYAPAFHKRSNRQKSAIKTLPPSTCGGGTYKLRIVLQTYSRCIEIF